MLVYIYDKSMGKSYTKNRRRLSSILFSVNKRSYIGNLPYRIIKQIILETRKDSSKNTSISIMVQSSDGYMGWKGFFIGKKPDLKYRPFELADSYIDLGK